MSTAKRTVVILACATISLLTATSAGAGSIIRMQTNDYRSSPPVPGTVTVAVEDDALRLDATGQSSDDAGSLVFKSNVNEMTAIDHSRKQFFVLDEVALRSIAGQVNDALQKMQESLAELPPEQRAMAQQMMHQRMGSISQEIKPRTISKTGVTESINGYDCDMYDVSEDGRKTRDMCVTSWGNIEGGADLAQGMVKMAGFFEDMREMFSKSGMDLMGSRSDVFSHMRETNGFPVRARNYNDVGDVIDETTLVSSEAQSIDAEEFMPPAGYTEQTMQQ